MPGTPSKLLASKKMALLHGFHLRPAGMRQNLPTPPVF
jgi:hypothetical protein